MTCVPSGTPNSSIGLDADSYYSNWTGDYPNSVCVHPYLCSCAPYYAKYQCEANGRETLLSQNSAECCSRCPAIATKPGLTVIEVTVNPPSCTVGDTVSITAHVSNTGTAAGSATVTFKYDDGTVIGTPQSTGVINVNTTVATFPIVVTASTSTGIFNVCATLS